MKTRVKITSTTTILLEHEEGKLPSPETHYADIYLKPHEGEYEDLGHDSFEVEVLEVIEEVV
jgi:hypothetical protein